MSVLYLQIMYPITYVLYTNISWFGGMFFVLVVFGLVLIYTEFSNNANY